MDCCCHQKTKHRSPEEQRSLINRLSRIEGQVRGLRDMLQKDAYCMEPMPAAAPPHQGPSSQPDSSTQQSPKFTYPCMGDGI